MAVISVIVPVYNVENYLCRCIDSILAQSFADFDVILIDDGSPDRSGEICDGYMQKDPRIHVIHQSNGGRSCARNAGVEWCLGLSDSDWITFIDSDDWVHPKYLEYLYRAAVSTNTPISSCFFSKEYLYKEPKELDEPEITVETPEQVWCTNRVNATVPVAKLYRKECYASIRYPEGINHEDEFITYQILFQFAFISIVNHPLYSYFQNENGIMLSPWTLDRLSFLDAYLGQVEFFRSHGYQNAYCVQARKFARACARSLDLIERHVSDKSLRTDVRQKWLSILQSFVRDHREQLTIRGNPRAMIYAIPGVYDVCCWTRACFRRMKNGKQQEKRGI